MAISLDFDVQYTFEVTAEFDVVFDLLSNVPVASSLHPTLEKITDLGGGVYRWEMKKYGIEKIHMQTIYTCIYTSDREAGLVQWKPTSGEGNAVVDGYFKLTRRPQGTQVDAHIKSTVEMPIPAIMKKLVVQFVATENKKLNEKYIHNLIQQFGGGRMLRL